MARPSRAGAGPSPLRRLAAMIAAWDAATDADILLRQGAASAVETVPGAEHAGIALVERHGMVWPAASSSTAHAIGDAENRVGEGPTLALCSGQEDSLVVHDLAHDDRWPRFAAQAKDAGAESILAYRLSHGRQRGHVLSVYASNPRAFDDDAWSLGRAFAGALGMALDRIVTAENFTAALRSRDVIGQAKGILMERGRMTADEAFDRLVAVSQQQQRKLSEVAAHLTATGALPGTGSPDPAPPSAARSVIAVDTMAADVEHARN